MIIIDDESGPDDFMNAAKCLHCGDVIRSRFRHEYVSCTCGAIAVDGGTSYIKRSLNSGAKWKEITTEKEFAAAMAEKAEHEKEKQQDERHE